MRPKLVIFDLDGTLVNSLTDLADACNYALRSAGFPLRQEEEIQQMVGNGISMLVERCLPPGFRNPETHAVVLQKFHEYYDAHSDDNTRAYPGIPALLEALHKQGTKLAVLTNKPHQNAVVLAARILPACIDLVLGQREGVPLKPEPHAVFEILERFMFPKSDCFYVGDSDTDIYTGKNAGLYTIGVTWGYRTKKHLEIAGANRIVDKVAELDAILVDNS